MCDFAFSGRELAETFGEAAEGIIAEARHLASNDSTPMFEQHGDLFVVSPERRPLIRTIAAKFDAYLSRGKTRHSAAV